MHLARTWFITSSLFATQLHFQDHKVIQIILQQCCNGAAEDADISEWKDCRDISVSRKVGRIAMRRMNITTPRANNLCSAWRSHAARYYAPPVTATFAPFCISLQDFLMLFSIKKWQALRRIGFSLRHASGSTCLLTFQDVQTCMTWIVRLILDGNERLHIKPVITLLAKRILRYKMRAHR